MQNQGQQVAVIGAGIIGINCAIAMQNKGYQVTLIDKGAPGEQCSKGNAGHFATEQVFPLAEFSVLWQLPKMLINPLGPVAISPMYFPKAIPWFCRFIINMFANKRTKNTQAIKQLNELAIGAYQELLQASGGEHLMVKEGSLLVFESTALEDIKKIQQVYQSQDVAVELLDKTALHKLEPNLKDTIDFALFFTDVAHTVCPLTLSKHLASYAQSLGVIYQQSAVEHVAQEGDHIVITTPINTQTFDQVVIATGAWSEKLANDLGYKLPIEGERGYSLDLPTSTIDKLSRPVASAERRFIITPMSHGLRLGGTVEFAGLNAPANYQRATMLHTNAQYIVNDLPHAEEITHQGWLGFRPSLPDSLPVIGRAPKHNKVIFALGHQHLGLTLGAITGKLVAQVVNHEQPSVNLSAYCISRFQ